MRGGGWWRRRPPCWGTQTEVVGSPSWVSPTIPPSCVQLVVLVDVDDPVSSIAELTALAFRCNLTLLLGWSDAECARYVV